MFLHRHKADVNFVNEHGNTALHYACFWNYPGIAEDLVDAGAKVNMENKYRETPLDKCQVFLFPLSHVTQTKLKVFHRQA